MQKTDTAKSPLLKPVIQRDYTAGLNINDASQVKPEPKDISPEPKPEETKQAGSQTTPGQSTAGQKFNIPKSDIKDDTKEFSFADIPESPGDITDEDHAEGINISSASAKTFANFAGDAIQMYLPKLAYGYCKIDIEDVIVNVQLGKLTINWVDSFSKINENTEQKLKISDESIKMWKKAFKDWLEWKNISFANPTTALIGASVAIVTELGINAYKIKEQNEEFMKQALEASNPGLFAKSGKTVQPEKPEQKESTDGADRKAA